MESKYCEPIIDWTELEWDQDEFIHSDGDGEGFYVVYATDENGVEYIGTGKYTGLGLEEVYDIELDN